MGENKIVSNVPEIKATRILEEYEGYNNYILSIKKKMQIKKHFKMTRAQADYIIDFHDVTPKIARKWVELDEYFGKKMMEEKLLTKRPTQIYVEKILVEKDKSFHIYGKLFENQEMYQFLVTTSKPSSKIKKDKLK